MKNSIFKRLVTLTVIMTMMFTVCITTAAAASDVTSSFSTEELAFINNNISKLGKYLSTDAAKYGNNDSITVTGTNGGTYYVVDGYTGKEVLNRVEFLMRKSDSSQMTSDKMNDLTDGLMIEADTNQAVTMLSGLSGFINLVLGLIVVVITMMMAVYTGFDVAYIAFPTFRNNCDEAKVSGQGPMVKQGNNGQTKLRFVTDEAQQAVQEVLSNNGGKSPWTIYLSRTAISYVMVAIILFMFATGNINIITNLAIKAVDGVMRVLQGLQF